MDSFILGAVFSAAVLNSLAPGPSIFLVLARTSTAGLIPGLVVTAGVLSAQMSYLAIAGAVLAYAIPLSEHLFTALRLGGAVLLTYIAWTLLAKPRDDPRLPPASRVQSDFFKGVMVGLANPFNLVFMFGVLPQVIPAAGLSPLDAAWIAVTVLVALAVPKIVLVFLASRLRRSAGLTTPWVSRAAALALLAYAAMAVAQSVAV